MYNTEINLLWFFLNILNILQIVACKIGDLLICISVFYYIFIPKMYIFVLFVMFINNSINCNIIFSFVCLFLAIKLNNNEIRLLINKLF